MRIIFTTLLLFMFLNISPKGLDKLLYGLDAGFSLSNTSWTIGGRPQIGYKFTTVRLKTKLTNITLVSSVLIF